MKGRRRNIAVNSVEHFGATTTYWYTPLETRDTSLPLLFNIRLLFITALTKDLLRIIACNIIPQATKHSYCMHVNQLVLFVLYRPEVLEFVVGCVQVHQQCFMRIGILQKCYILIFFLCNVIIICGLFSSYCNQTMLLIANIPNHSSELCPSLVSHPFILYF